MILYDLKLPLLGYKDKLRHKPSKDGMKLFDPIRKKWLKSQNEELVRQLCILYFQDVFQINDAAIVVEKKIEIDSIPKRLDLLILKQAEPLLLIECKSFKESLTFDHFIQVSNYNREVCAPYVLLCNGHQSFLFNQFGDSLQSLDRLFLTT